MDEIKNPHNVMQGVVFKAQVIKSINVTVKQAAIYEAGPVSFAPSWKDWLGIAGITIASTVSASVFSVLATLGIIAAILSPQITLPIALIGVGANIGFAIYRFQKKRKEYAVVSHLFEGRSVEDDLAKISEITFSLYKNHIINFTEDDAKKFGKKIGKVICYAMMKGRVSSIDDLLYPPVLHKLLLSLSERIPKELLRTQFGENVKRYMRSYITKSGVYCEENTHVYVNKHAKPDKYGVVFMKSRKEWKAFRSLTKNDREYTVLPQRKSDPLIKHSIFNMSIDSDLSSIVSSIEESSDYNLSKSKY